jgi:hypothetical protein
MAAGSSMARTLLPMSTPEPIAQEDKATVAIL